MPDLQLHSCTGKGNSPRKVYTANSKQSSLSNGSAITRAQTAVKWTHSKATLMTSAPVQDREESCSDCLQWAQGAKARN